MAIIIFGVSLQGNILSSFTDQPIRLSIEIYVFLLKQFYSKIAFSRQVRRRKVLESHVKLLLFTEISLIAFRFRWCRLCNNFLFQLHVLQILLVVVEGLDVFIIVWYSSLFAFLLCQFSSRIIHAKSKWIHSFEATFNYQFLKELIRNSIMNLFQIFVKWLKHIDMIKKEGKEINLNTELLPIYSLQTEFVDTYL